MAINVRVTGTKELMQALARAGARAEMAAKAALYQEAERVMAQSKQEAPVGVDGVLRASGFVELPKPAGRGWRVTLGYGGAAKSYAAVIHEGRTPGKRPPPSKAIEPWVKKKMGVPADEVAGVAFVVARSIGKKGTRPTKFLERPLNAAAAGMASRMAKRIRAQMERK